MTETIVNEVNEENKIELIVKSQDERLKILEQEVRCIEISINDILGFLNL